MAPLEDLGFMALGEGQWLPVSLEWLETFFIAILGGWMVLLWLTRILLNMHMGGPKVAIAGRDFPDRPVLIIPVRFIWSAWKMFGIDKPCRGTILITSSSTAMHPDAGHSNFPPNGHDGRGHRPPSLYHLPHDAGPW